MEEAKADVLRKLRIYISGNMDAKKVVEQLFSRGILDKDDHEVILAETTTSGKVLKLLDLLPLRRPEAFDAFLQALHECGFGHLANTIQSKTSAGKCICSL